MASIDRPALAVDLYELTMLDVYRRERMATRPATFSLFVRRIPPGRGYLVAAGLADALFWLSELRYDAEDLAALRRLGVFDEKFLDWLAGLRFTGTVRAVPEGTVVFADEPILEVEAPLAQAQVAETFLLNAVTVHTVLASKAARYRDAAGDRAVVDFALRRTHGLDAGMSLARVARLVGLDATSNVAGADRYGLAASGTMAHSFVQAHDDETAAFRAYARAHGPASVLLVDTYDTERGIARAVRVAAQCRRDGVTIRALRLDSGDLAAHARRARQALDQAGLAEVQVLASGGLDEHDIARLVAEGAPIDGFGVGTSLGVSADAPALDSVYKLVAYDGRPVRKTSAGKATWPGAKQVWRAGDWSADVLAAADEPAPGPGYRPLLGEVMVDGRRTPAGSVDLAEAAASFTEGFAQVPERVRRLDSPQAHTVEVSDRLRSVAADLDARQAKEDP